MFLFVLVGTEWGGVVLMHKKCLGIDKVRRSTAISPTFFPLQESCFTSAFAAPFGVRLQKKRIVSLCIPSCLNKHFYFSG
jgi:hypothetical protein